MGWIEQFNQAVEPLSNGIVAINDFLWGYILIAILIPLGVYFTVRTRAVQIRHFKEMIMLLGDGIGKKKENKNSLSSFQAFAISTASRVGTGNIVGVTIAIVTGGPGAVFWMWIVALVGAASSFVESTLAQLYKERDEDGGFIGGPAFYMEKGLKKRWMGVLFSILITICFGFIFNAVQANTIAQSIKTTYGFDPAIIGIILAVVTGIVIFGGVKRIAHVSEVLVPVMAGAYILLAIYILITNIGALPQVVSIIFKNAFGLEQIIGGTFGGVVMLGVKRGLFSNEAGMGSAPNVAATADVSHPVKQGLIQSLGVFTDTLLICSATAFMILLPTAGNIQPDGLQGIGIVNNILTAELGSWASIFLTFSVTLFAISSVFGNYYYGESNIEFLTSKRVYLYLYRFIVVFMVFFGAIAELEVVWNMADLFMGLMALLNLVAIVLLGKYAFRLLEDYEMQKVRGVKNPVFQKETIPELENITEW